MLSPQSSQSQQHIAQFVDLLSRIVGGGNERRATRRSKGTMYHSSETDHRASICELVLRFETQLRCSESCFALALVYIDRVIKMSTDGLEVNSHTIRRILTASLLIANQMLDDISEHTSRFATLARIPARLMVDLKHDILRRTKFFLLVPPEEIFSFSDLLQGRFSTSGFQKLGLMWNSDPGLSSPISVCTPPRQYGLEPHWTPMMSNCAGTLCENEPLPAFSELLQPILPNDSPFSRFNQSLFQYHRARIHHQRSATSPLIFSTTASPAVDSTTMLAPSELSLHSFCPLSNLHVHPSHALNQQHRGSSLKRVWVPIENDDDDDDDDESLHPPNIRRRVLCVEDRLDGSSNPSSRILKAYPQVYSQAPILPPIHLTANSSVEESPSFLSAFLPSPAHLYLFLKT